MATNKVMGWHGQIAVVKPHIIRIMTPRGSGTGFLLYHSKSKGYTAVATAAHVIRDAHNWEEPIRLAHSESGRSILVKATNRAVLMETQKDVAAMTFRTEELVLPTEPLALSPKDEFFVPGVEIGWLGFPAVARELCFFSGRISAYLEAEARYLVDGVAINGVSGSPAFIWDDGHVSLMGVLSAYIPNRATGEVLPGVAVVADIAEFHSIVASFKSFDEAQASQSAPSLEAGHSP